MKPLHLFLAAAGLLAATAPARAQIAVSLTIKERIHIRHEPILATVTVTNNTGRDITLEDTRQGQWFGFQINSGGDRFVAPRDPNYRLDPLPIRSGETLKRTVNLNDLYPLGEYGTYAIRANIFFAGQDRYFNSKPTHVEITDGRVIWQRAVGVPEGGKDAGQTHVYTLLTHQRGEQNLLYVRVENQDEGSVFCTNPLGRVIDGVRPSMELDNRNNLYVLHLVGLRRFALSKIGVHGEFLGQTYYTVPKARPYLRKQPDGSLQLVGGQREEVARTPANLPPPAKLSDRPPGLPK